jgi:multidrug resistance efflux pump
MTDHKEIELRSEEVQEILGTPPRWIVRWGIALVSMVVLVLFAGSYFFKYPDIIKGRVTIISRNPPVTLVARADGKIDHLFVADQQKVSTGTVLAILENPAFYRDVYTLQARLDTVRGMFDAPEGFISLKFEENLMLGQIHSYYTAFVSHSSEYVNFSRFDLYRERVETLRRQVADQERYLDQLVSQARILDDKLQLSRRQYNRDTELARQNVISASDLEKSESEYLGNELNHRTAIANMTSTRNQINQMQRQVAELQAERGEQNNRLLAGLREKFDNLIAQISVWEQNYVFKTPIEGTVTFTNIWSVNQQVSNGTPVFSVVPEENTIIIGRVEIPLTGSGKVESGQRVKIKLDNYPHLEYGMLEGQIAAISLVPYNSPQGAFYTAELELQNGLLTNYGTELPFNQEMTGVAEIVTNDRRLIERLVQPLTSVVRDRILTH